MDEIKEFKRKIFNILKCNIDHDNDKKMNVLKENLKQYNETYEIVLSQFNKSDDKKYIKVINGCILNMAKLKRIIKLKSDLTDDDEIVIQKKMIGVKINEERIKTYYIDNIEELKEYIDNIKTYESPQKKPVYNIDNAFTPAFIDFFCRKYGISHYAYDINKTCFMQYVHKNQITGHCVIML